MSLFGRIPSWWARAACRGRQDIMFGEDVELAKGVCALCPVQRECLMAALDMEPSDGVWGGLTWDERIMLCPVCGEPKRDRVDLGCRPAHEEYRLGQFEALEELNTPDERNPDNVVVTLRMRPTQRTNPYCLVQRGQNHASARAHKEGCRCEESRDALRAERRRRRLSGQTPLFEQEEELA